MGERKERRDCGCVIIHKRDTVCAKHSQLPEEMRDRISEMLSKTVNEQIEAAVKLETEALSKQADGMKEMLFQASATIHLHLHDRPEDTQSNEDCKRPACAKLMAYVTGKKGLPLEMNRDVGWLKKMADIENGQDVSVGGLAAVPGSGFNPCKHEMKGDCSGNWWCDLCGKKM